MIINSICSIVRRRTRQFIELTSCNLNLHQNILINQQTNQYTFSTQQEKIKDRHQSSQQPVIKNHRKIQIKQSSQNISKPEKVYRKNLIQQIRDFRQSLSDQQFSFSSFAIFSKQYASYYKKSNHGQYNRAKDQIQRLLIKCKQCQVKKFSLTQFTNVLDFIRTTSNIEVINNHLLDQVRFKMFDLIQSILQNVSNLTLNQICLLYSKLNPLHYPKIFSISSVLHDKLAEKFDQKKGLQISLMQLFVLIKSMSKKQFLSFPDKKILEMALIDLKYRDKIDNSMILQLSMAFKDIDIKANLSNYSIYTISYRICNKAIKIVKRGLKNQQIQKILTSKHSKQDKFQQIIQEIYAQLIEKLKGNHNYFYSKINLNLFILAIKQFPIYHRFKIDDKSILIEYINKLCLQYHNNSQFFEYLEPQLLNLARTNFFDKDINLLDNLMKSPHFSTKWSFIFEYSYRHAAFPIELLQKKLESIEYYNMKIDSKFIKRIVSVSRQRKLHPKSEILEVQYQKWLQVIKKYGWSMQSLQTLIKISYTQDSRLVQQFHNQFNHFYMQTFYPSKVEIERQKKIRRGQKSQLFIFWQYLLQFGGFQTQIPFDIINNIPVYSIYVLCHKIKQNKNKEIVPRVMMLIALNSMLQNKLVNVKDKQISLIIQVLAIYIDNVGAHYQGILDIFCSILRLFIKQFQKIDTNIIPNFKHLIIKLLNTHDLTIRNSLYYRQFVIQLLSNPIIFGTDNAHQYFKTSILRQALSMNLIHDIHLSQLQYNYFSKDQTELLKSLTHQYKIQQFTPFTLVCYLKADKDLQTIQRDFNAICTTIENSTLVELGQYLTHYSLQRKEWNDKILIKICQKFTSSLNLKDNNIDIVGIIINIRQKLNKIDINLLFNLVISILGQVSQHLELLCLSNHLYMLKLIQQNGYINDKHQIIDKYRRSLWKYVKSNKNHGYISLDIMLQISKIEDIFTTDDFQFVQCFAFNKPLAYLKVILLSHQQEALIKQKVHLIASLFTKPTQKSIYTQYFETKYKKILSMQRVKKLHFKKANPLALQLLRILQSFKITLKLQQLQGQFLYKIGQKLIIFFTDNKNRNELNFMTKYIKIYRQNFQNIQILHFHTNPNRKQQVIELLLKINEVLIQKLNGQQLQKIEQMIFLK